MGELNLGTVPGLPCGPGNVSGKTAPTKFVGRDALDNFEPPSISARFELRNEFADNSSPIHSDKIVILTSICGPKKTAKRAGAVAAVTAFL